MAAIAVVLLVAVAPAGAIGGSAAAPPVDLTRLPPDRPVKVTLGVELLRVSRIEDHDEQFDIEFNLFLSWKDPRLAFDGSRAGHHKRVVPAERIWKPEPDLVDDLGVTVQDGRSAHLLPDGTVRWRRYYRGTVSSNFDLHEFPFDAHRLEVRLEANSTDVGEVLYVAGESTVRDEEGSGSPLAVPHGWKLVRLSTGTAESRFPQLDEAFSRFMVRVEIRRNPHYYWWAIVLPLLPIVATSWSVFWMDPTEFNSQASVGMTAMLTVVAYRITIDSSLPLLSYMTRMDYFLLICQIWVFGAFLMSVAIHVCHSQNTAWSVSLARRLGECCRWLPPLALCASCALLASAPPSAAMALLAAAASIALLACRPTPRRIARWCWAALFPERAFRRCQPPAEEQRRRSAA